MMWKALLLGSCCLLQILTFGLIVWAAHEYIRARQLVDHITCCMQHIVAVTGSNMQMDEIVDGTNCWKLMWYVSQQKHVLVLPILQFLWNTHKSTVRDLPHWWQEARPNRILERH